MAYAEQSDIEGMIDPAIVVQALDDDKDGVADPGIWDQIYEDVEEDIHGRVAPRQRTPFVAPIPSLIVRAAKVLLCEALYLRRGMAGDQNPWVRRADEMRAKLDKVGTGALVLERSAAEARASDVIGEASKLYLEDGRMLV